MGTQVKHRRGTNAEVMAGTPALGELWFNTTDNTIHMGDGFTMGGIKQSKELQSAALAAGCSYSEIIYSTDTISEIPANIFDAESQVTYSVPEDAQGELIVSVDNGTLTTAIGSYNMAISSASILSQIKTDSYIGLVVGSDWSDALMAALTLAGITGLSVLLPSPSYGATYSKTIVVPENITLVGYGIAKWVAGFADMQSAPSEMIFTGTGDKTHTFDDISNLDVSGGSIANPDALEAYCDDASNAAYEFTDLTNADAIEEVRSTLKLVSVAIELKHGARLQNIRVVLDNGGIDNYNDTSSLSLGADWDIGVLENQVRGTGGDRCQIVGYWRVAGLAKLYAVTDGSYTNSENSSWSNSVFQGYRGFLGRGNDTYMVSATTTTTISIPWSASHCFESTGNVRVGGGDVEYTDLDFVSDTLVFTVSSHNASTGSTLRKSGSNFGSSGSQFIDCEIHDLMHSSRLMACSNEIGFTSSSCAIEISGEPSRAIQFTNSTVIGRDDALSLLGNCRDILFTSTYFESSNGRLLSTDDIFSGTLSNGGRIIAINESGSVCANLRFLGHSDTYVDMSPRMQGNDLPNRFTLGGLFTPRETWCDKYDMNIREDGEIKIGSKSVNTRLWADDATYFQNTSNNAEIRSGAGSFNVFSGLRVRLGISESECFIAEANKFYPVEVGSSDLGDSFHTYLNAYLVNSPIVSSDENLKEQRGGLSIGELNAAKKIARLPKMFQWLSEIDKKSSGDGTVYFHCSPMAQSVWDALDVEGLDASSYGFISKGGEDKEGNKTNWHIQPQELLWMICASQQSQLDDFESRLEALES